jgi:hypothetical protein
MTNIRAGVPVPARGAPSGEDEGVDTFNDLLGIVTRCLPEGGDSFTQAAYVWTGYTVSSRWRRSFPRFPGHLARSTFSA